MNSKIEEVEYNHLQMTSILKSISHGILAVDIDGNIMLINDEAKSILKCNEDKIIEGKNINIIIQESSLLKEIALFKGSKESKYVEITTDDEIVYSINLDPIYLQDMNNVIIGSIINIKDITEKVKLENMRTDFVANVSHELKTPLTSISGFVETLKLNENIDVATRNRFLGIIESESDRLKRLIDDILLLSFIEKNETKSLELVNIYEIFIKQIFLNLIDNAIKYTPENNNVYVEVYYDKNNLVIKVGDNGIGIPKEDINRIFERFYRVDKARSRDVGGTGLGLAIIKHIVKSLDGTINVKSELGQGSEFIITIPKKFP